MVIMIDGVDGESKILKIDAVCGKSVDSLPLGEVSFASPGANVRAYIEIPT